MLMGTARCSPKMILQLCRAGLSRMRVLRATSIRHVSSNTTASEVPESFRSVTTPSSSFPRWKQTPPQMKAPIQMDFAKNPVNKVWTVNNDPAKLDAMYNRLLGQGGSQMLPEELKWLAVTHKSFDQGRRGFNDKLALMGRFTLIMETTKSIVSKAPAGVPHAPDEYGREPFQHPKLHSVDNLIYETPIDTAGKDKLSAFAEGIGLLSVLRWKPRQTTNLDSSGLETILTGSLYAIVGAITLQHGLAVASKVVRDRILTQLPKTKAREREVDPSLR